MNVTYACPQCDEAARVEFTDHVQQLQCPHCGERVKTPEGAVEDGRVGRCLVCPSTELFVRKDFPQHWGVAIVAVGIIGSSVAWYHANLLWTFGILFATALADVLLYTLVGDALMCYRCNAMYRGTANMESHGSFNLETHERYRQLAARIRTTPPQEPI